MLKSTLRLYML